MASFYGDKGHDKVEECCVVAYLRHRKPWNIFDKVVTFPKSCMSYVVFRCVRERERDVFDF